MIYYMYKFSPVKYQWTWVQYYNVDVWLLFTAVFSLLLYVTFKLLKL